MAVEAEESDMVPEKVREGGVVSEEAEGDGEVAVEVEGKFKGVADAETAMFTAVVL